MLEKEKRFKLDLFCARSSPPLPTVYSSPIHLSFHPDFTMQILDLLELKYTERTLKIEFN
ncbi:hypothetical protein QR98_0030030 [Sarcoptes scabiei]|uniref:Uncharacterized protein n=1 Tax=Sarcoptes scabiei TaxID=52283 RepID=A0A132A0U2_SARSC|nr:hypothetical protein QR98_0030030 [Sarcoptes scabiei]